MSIEAIVILAVVALVALIGLKIAGKMVTTALFFIAAIIAAVYFFSHGRSFIG